MIGHIRPWPSRAIAVSAMLGGSSVASAQAWSHPSFQPPHVVSRDFTFGVAAAGDAGTTLLGQWREGISPVSQLSLEGGIADPKGEGTHPHLLVGGQFAYQIATRTADQPLDFLGTAGAFAALGGGGSLIRLPVGVSVGHRFALEDGMALTPYVHPRVSLDFCGSCSGTSSELGIDFDVGASFEVTRELALRGSFFFGGSDLARRSANGFGLALTWTPPPLSR